MGKTYTKAAKRRAKKALPSLSPVPRPKKRGRERMAEIQREGHDRNPQQTALEARARMMGVKDLSAMKAQALGEAAGRAIYLSHEPDDAAKLWDVYARFTATEERYASLVLGKGLHAKTAKIETMTERFETRDDDSPDLRTEDERHRDASNAWARWRGYLGHLSAFDQNAIMCVVRGRNEPVKDGKVTQTGQDFVQAVERLADVVD